MRAGIEVRIKDGVEPGAGMRGVTSNPVHPVASGIAIVQLIGMPLGLMEFKEDELEII